jgi:hypothetical protein
MQQSIPDQVKAKAKLSPEEQTFLDDYRKFEELDREKEIKFF